MKCIERLAYLVAGIAIAGGAIALAPISGELDPPAGPVSETTPSLQRLADLISAGSVGSPPAEGWSTAVFAPGSLSDDQRGAVEIVSGRVFVHQVVVLNAAATVFDGQDGRVNSEGTPTQGNPVTHAHQRYLSENSTGKGQQTAVTIVQDVVIENGLYLAYELFAHNATVQIYYTQLD